MCWRLSKTGVCVLCVLGFVSVLLSCLQPVPASCLHGTRFPVCLANCVCLQNPSYNKTFIEIARHIALCMCVRFARFEFDECAALWRDPKAAANRLRTLATWLRPVYRVVSGYVCVCLHSSVIWLRTCFGKHTMPWTTISFTSGPLAAYARVFFVSQLCCCAG